MNAVVLTREQSLTPKGPSLLYYVCSVLSDRDTPELVETTEARVRDLRHW